jgi:hypothetical protein
VSGGEFSRVLQERTISLQFFVKPKSARGSSRETDFFTITAQCE